MKKLILIVLTLICSLNAKEIYATFDVQAVKSANLSFDSTGIVKDVFVDIGSKVKKNDILASLNNDESKARLAVNKISLKYAEIDYDRQKKIKNLIDKEKFDQYAYKYENAKAEVAYQESVVDKTYLKAPFDGVIISKSVESGDMVSSQAAKTLLQIESTSNIKLVLKFDSKYWNEVKKGQKFEYTLDGDNTKYSGEIFKVYPTINNETRTLSAEVLTNNIPTSLFGTGFILTE
ncbi:MAG: efflux RND transporter periplasmic adaptor subunit [Aliarcobacter sp.]|nr:efflux RND transporter periplasmic adaptor subunit [Aliarcobacter sp.]